MPVIDLRGRSKTIMNWAAGYLPYCYRGLVVYVVDGDTFDIVIDLGFHIKHEIRVRLKDADTPELNSPNEAERKHANAAREWVEEQLYGRVVEIRTFKDKKGKYGRYIADIYYHNDKGDLLHLATTLKNHNMMKLEEYPE